MKSKIIRSKKGAVIAYIISNINNNESGTNFISMPEDPFQIAIIGNNKEYEVRKHFHPENKKVIYCISECIIIRIGKVEIKFYDEDTTFISEYIAKSGDIVLFLKGGHSLYYAEKSMIIEIRQGPYNKEFDKEYF